MWTGRVPVAEIGFVELGVAPVKGSIVATLLTAPKFRKIHSPSENCMSPTPRCRMTPGPMFQHGIPRVALECHASQRFIARIVDEHQRPLQPRAAACGRRSRGDRLPNCSWQGLIRANPSIAVAALVMAIVRFLVDFMCTSFLICLCGLPRGNPALVTWLRRIRRK